MLNGTLTAFFVAATAKLKVLPVCLLDEKWKAQQRQQITWVDVDDAASTKIAFN